MSGNKMTDTKISQDLGDSGFHSGVQVLYPGDEDSGELRPESKETEPEKAVPRARDDNKVSSDSQSLNVDSGMVDYVSGDLSAELVRIDLKTETDSAKTDKLSQSLNVDSGIVDYVSGDLSPEVVCIDLKTGTDSAKTVRPPALGLPLEFLFQQDDDGDTQLHIAAYHGYEKPVSTLLRVCPNKELLNVCNDYGQTALHLAVLSQNPVITRMLVLAGADIGIRDRRGETPLHKATALSAVKCIQALLMPVHGHPQRKNTAVLNQKNYSGKLNTLQYLILIPVGLVLPSCKMLLKIQ
ncbi:Cactus [Operophtera brumata]|uniref:Cactus n=1 Tax=Operophtera brumata TaxID=104452 RepID=A0A0L7KXL4_OPEBR|nr:Cactus [Operophtera brumata]